MRDLKTAIVKSPSVPALGGVGETIDRCITIGQKGSYIIRVQEKDLRFNNRYISVSLYKLIRFPQPIDLRLMRMPGN